MSESLLRWVCPKCNFTVEKRRQRRKFFEEIDKHRIVCGVEVKPIDWRMVGRRKKKLKPRRRK